MMSGWGPEMALKRATVEDLGNTKVLHTLFSWIFESCGILSLP